MRQRLRRSHFALERAVEIARRIAAVAQRRIEKRRLRRDETALQRLQVDERLQRGAGAPHSPHGIHLPPLLRLEVERAHIAVRLARRHVHHHRRRIVHTVSGPPPEDLLHLIAQIGIHFKRRASRVVRRKPRRVISGFKLLAFTFRLPTPPSLHQKPPFARGPFLFPFRSDREIAVAHPFFAEEGVRTFARH